MHHADNCIDKQEISSVRWATVATIDMSQKGGGTAVPLSWRAGTPTKGLTQCGLGRGLLLYQVASSSIQPFGHNRHEPKMGDVPHLWGAATPSNTTSPEPTFTSVPSDMLIHLAAWPHDMGQNLGEGWVCFFLG